MATNFLVGTNNTDLSDIFLGYSSGNTAPATGYYVGSDDLNQLFDPIGTSTSFPTITTNYLVNNGTTDVDLNTVFNSIYQVEAKSSGSTVYTSQTGTATGDTAYYYFYGSSYNSSSSTNTTEYSLTFGSITTFNYLIIGGGGSGAGSTKTDTNASGGGGGGGLVYGTATSSSQSEYFNIFVANFTAAPAVGADGTDGSQTYITTSNGDADYIYVTGGGGGVGAGGTPGLGGTIDKVAGIFNNTSTNYQGCTGGWGANSSGQSGYDGGNAGPTEPYTIGSYTMMLPCGGGGGVYYDAGGNPTAGYPSQYNGTTTIYSTGYGGGYQTDNDGSAGTNSSYNGSPPSSNYFGSGGGGAFSGTSTSYSGGAGSSGFAMIWFTIP